ncbi:MAG: hypothetical protein A3J08_00400 [Candidatus Lloydbacteria bacterium RIFCSPLOWO2_02_FULL_51_11]|nr:MAG: hypothetical protein A3J08_00400 [Candidatus Lloydbacteria bacterium RIFCSPLOWO2_02_FULL_51_11]
MKQQRWLIIVTLAFLVFPGIGFGQSSSKSVVASPKTMVGVEDAAKRLPKNIFAEISKIPETPHFLQGFSRETDAWKAFREVVRFIRTQDIARTGIGKGVLDRSKSGYEQPSGETAVLETLTFGQKDVRIYYTHYHVRATDRMYTFWLPSREQNLAEYSPLYRKYEVRWGNGGITDAEWLDIQRVLGWAQFYAVRSFTESMIREGLAKNLKDYNEIMRLTERVQEIRAQRFADTDYAKHLTDSIPGPGNLTNQDILPVPLTRPEDFLPELIVIQPARFVGGFTNAFHVPGSETLVMLSQSGLALQYISGFNLASHEMVHANPYLQGIPLDFYFDAEMWASMTSDVEGSALDYLGHPYLALIRHLVRTYFGYDHEEVLRKILPKGLPIVDDIREEEFRKAVADIKTIQAELTRFIKDPNNGVIVRFYSDPYFWIGVNTKFCDSAAAFRLLFATRYEPAGFFDPTQKDREGVVVPPEVQTRQWLLKEEEAGRIKRLAERALADTGKESDAFKNKGKFADVGGQTKCPVDSRFFYTEMETRKEMETVAAELYRRAMQGDIEALLFLERAFKTTSVFALPMANH